MHEFCQVATTDRNLSSCKRNCVTFIDRHGMGNTLTTVKDGSSGLTVCEEGEDSLVTNVQLWDFEFRKPETEN